jgi:hypothetical protein
MSFKGDLRKEEKIETKKKEKNKGDLGDHFPFSGHCCSGKTP